MKKKGNSLRRTGEYLVSFGMKNGADEVEVTAVEGFEFEVDVRLGEIENLVEAGSRYVGFRVIKDKKTAYATSSDFSRETLERLMKNAVKRAVLSSVDEYAGLPPLSTKKVETGSLDLFDPEIAELPAERKIALARETEKIALADRRITNSHGASFETNEGCVVIVNSQGFSGSFDYTLSSLSLGLQAGETDSRVEDYWSSSARHLKELESPEEIAAKAVQRTVRQLNPKKIKTQKVPVVFEPTMVSWLLGFLFACISGVSIYQKLSFLADKLGQKIANEKVTVIDDGLMPGRLGSRPFDSEGVPCQKTIVVDKGVLKNYLCDTYSARKLNLRSTGNASGTSVGPHNFYLQAGRHSPEEIISSVKKGLVLIRTLGHGLNPVTGDVSRGAFGLWVEEGEIAFPVSEITIAGNLGDILNNIEMIGNDLEFRRQLTGPTIKVRELTVAGL